MQVNRDRQAAALQTANEIAKRALAVCISALEDGPSLRPREREKVLEQAREAKRGLERA